MTFVPFCDRQMTVTLVIGDRTTLVPDILPLISLFRLESLFHSAFEVDYTKYSYTKGREQGLIIGPVAQSEYGMWQDSKLAA